MRSVAATDNDGNVTELSEHLPARAAGRGRREGRRIDHNGLKRTLPCQHGSKNRDTLCTHRQPTGGVLDIAARENLAVRTQHRRTHPKVAVRTMRLPSRVLSSRQQAIEKFFGQIHERHNRGLRRAGLSGVLATPLPDNNVFQGTFPESSKTGSVVL